MMSHLLLTPISFLYFRERICLIGNPLSPVYIGWLQPIDGLFSPCFHILYYLTAVDLPSLSFACCLSPLYIPFFLPLTIRYSVHIWNISLYLGKRSPELSYYYILSLTSLSSTFLLYTSCNFWIMSINYIGAGTISVFTHHCVPKV